MVLHYILLDKKLLQFERIDITIVSYHLHLLSSTASVDFEHLPDIHVILTTEITSTKTFIQFVRVCIGFQLLEHHKCIKANPSWKFETTYSCWSGCSSNLNL